MTDITLELYHKKLSGRAFRVIKMKIKYNDIEIIRQINTVMVLNVLRKSDRLLSRPNMADELGLSKVTIANIIHDLHYLGFTTDAGLGTTDRRGGRKPVLVSLDRDRKRVMGAYLTHGVAEIVLSDITGRELKRLRAKLGQMEDPGVLTSMAIEVLEQTGTPRSSVLGLVLALNSSRYNQEPRAGGGTDVEDPSPLALRLSQAIGGIPVWLVDFARARAFGECWFNHEFQSPAQFFYVKLSHNFGCLAARHGILDEEPGEYASCAMSFLGHDSQDEVCSTVASALCGQDFLNKASEMTGRRLNSRMTIRLAEEGDQRIVEHFGKFGYNLGCALSLMVNMDGFQKIIIGGFLSKGWPYFQATMRQGLEKHLAPKYQGGSVEVRPLHRDLDSGLLGAQALALDRWVYHTELLYSGRG